jgi:glycosyltransferase involved in cell wall biosynthesis
VATKPSIAVVSPFVDRQHGTERCLAEQLERLAEHFEIHLYSCRVQDIDLHDIYWHRVPELPGPHLFAFLWWFAANHILRWWDRTFRSLRPMMVYSPGINCLDADVIAVHIVFEEFCRQVGSELRLRSNPVAAWPRIVHRRLYYWVARQLERYAYALPRILLTPVSHKVADDLLRFFKRTENVYVIYNGCEISRFQPQRRTELREAARYEFALSVGEIALLLVGNDWKKKGLSCLLDAVRLSAIQSLRVLVVGKDDERPFRAALASPELSGRVQFLPPRPDVEFYYAAADIYAGPSLEDAFSLPPLEAMACGLPVITSRNAGVSEIISHAKDGFILEDASDANELAKLLQLIAGDSELRDRIGKAAVVTASQYTWDRNASQLISVLEGARQQAG